MFRFSRRVLLNSVKTNLQKCDYDSEVRYKFCKERWLGIPYGEYHLTMVYIRHTLHRFQQNLILRVVQYRNSVISGTKPTIILAGSDEDALRK